MALTLPTKQTKLFPPLIQQLKKKAFKLISMGISEKKLCGLNFYIILLFKMLATLIK